MWQVRPRHIPHLAGRYDPVTPGMTLAGMNLWPERPGLLLATAGAQSCGLGPRLQQHGSKTQGRGSKGRRPKATHRPTTLTPHPCTLQPHISPLTPPATHPAPHTNTPNPPSIHPYTQPESPPPTHLNTLTPLPWTPPGSSPAQACCAPTPLRAPATPATRFATSPLMPSPTAPPPPAPYSSS